MGLPPGLNLHSGNQWCIPRTKQQDVESSSDCSGSTVAVTTDSSDHDTNSSDGETSQPHLLPKPVQPDTRTTLIMQNIPNRHTRSMLLALFDEAGFSGTYDMVYLPTDFATKVAFGYAFVNLKSSREAEKFMDYFQGFNRWGCNSEKVCTVTWSGSQGGLESLIRRYRNCSVMHESVSDEFKPALFANGLRVPFPAPTQRLRKPRVPTSTETAKTRIPPRSSGVQQGSRR